MLEGILSETYGFFLYQEQVMLTANVMGGYTMAMADGLRKAMGKKKMPKRWPSIGKFSPPALCRRAWTRKVAVEIFDTMEKFAAYGFNKSHSAAYAIVSYQTAYLKANYRMEYMAALMSSVLSSRSTRSRFFIKECQDSSRGSRCFRLTSTSLDCGLLGLSQRHPLGAGRGAQRGPRPRWKPIMLSLAKTDGPFKDLSDLCHRVDLSSGEQTQCWKA
jgi:DNA polymerase-3 subunit alpha